MEKSVDIAAVRMFVRAALTLGRDPRETFDMLYLDEREALLRSFAMPREAVVKHGEPGRWPSD